MDALLISTVQGVPFNADRVRVILEGTIGVTRFFEGGINAVFEAHYEYGGYATIARLKENKQTISVARINDASIQLAYLLQQGYPEPLRVIDLDYSFDLVMDTFASATEMSEVMYTAIEKAAAETDSPSEKRKGVKKKGKRGSGDKS